MTEEEKNAINFLQKLEFDEYEWWYFGEEYETREETEKAFEKAQKIIINLIDKQQKEIEYYKDELEKESSIWTKIEKGNDYISKDKIREKIKDLKNNLKSKEEQNEYFETLAKIEILEELLRW